jgi:ubiquitin-conjugating enzyme E2 Z
MKHIMTTRISKETITRLLKDVKQIMKNPLTENGIYYIHDDTDILKGYALIIGPSETPYFGGNYFFEFNYPADYPHTPPTVKYWTNGNNVRFNPNLYVCGKVCVSLLNTWRGDQWTSCQSISTVLLTLCTLLCKDPLLNEPGVEKGHRDMITYDEIIQFANLDIAVCDIVDKKQGVFMPFFENFYPFVRENFNKNFDKFIAFAEKKHKELGSVATDFKTGFYSMTIRADYETLIYRLKTAYAIAQIM